MTRAAWSLLAFGLYLAMGGIVLLGAPRTLCWVLGLAPPEGVWVRLVGMFFLLFAFYCVRAAREEQTSFMRWSLWTRPTTIVFLLGFVAARLVEPIMLLFGVVDLLAAAWTALALRADERTLGKKPDAL